MFHGRLTISPTRLDEIKESSDTLFYKTVSGDTIPVINSLGDIAHLSFLADPADAAQSYSLSGLTPGKEYDVWVTENNATAVLGLAEWAPKRAYGSGVYGSDFYSDGLHPSVWEVPYRGIPVNSDEITLRLDSGDALIVAVHRASFLGSVIISGDEAVIRCHKTYGEKREWGIWNAHNQKPIALKGGATKPYTLDLINAPGICSPEWAPWLSNYDVYIQVFSGRPETIDCQYHHAAWLQSFIGSDNSAVISGAIGFGRTGGFGVNTHQNVAVDNPPGIWWQYVVENSTAGNYLALGNSQCARYIHPSNSGSVKVWGLVWTQNIKPENVVNAGVPFVSMWGQENRMLLTAEWMG